MPAETAQASHEVADEVGRLVEFAALTRFEDLPPEVVRKSKEHIIDWLGVCIGAADQDASRILLDYVRQAGGAPQGSVLVHDFRTDVANAALANGVMAHVLDFDDTHIPTILHPTTPVMAAALPAAEWLGRDGADVVAAHAVAVEVSARAALAVHPQHYDVGWHVTGTMGTLGGMVAAGRLLDLTTVQFAHAFGTAATQAAGHREQFGAMTKSFHAGRAASGGALAALLAAKGFTAAPGSLAGRRGLFSVMSTASDTSRLTEGLGTRWEIFQVGIKPYSCGLVAHPAIDAARCLRVDHGVEPQDVESLTLTVHPLVVELTGKKDPRTGLEGKFSVAFACAAALIDGPPGPRHFTDDYVRRPDVVDLRDRVRTIPEESLAETEAHAMAALRDGREISVSVRAATGTPGNPMTPAALHRKFHDLVDPVLGEDAAAQIVDMVADLEAMKSVDELIGAARRPAG